MKTEKSIPLEGRRILIAASGSIAAVKTPLLVSELVKSGAQVRCLLTPSAAKIISPLSLSTLSRHRCYQEDDQWSPEQTKPLHIELTEWAEIVVIAPLSASTLARWTQGISEGLLASVLLASEKPVIAAVAMNTAMWENIYVKKNWNQLKKNKRTIALPPSNGLLACDRIGEGRMASTDLIELAIRSSLLKRTEKNEFSRDWEGERLVVTAGPTQEVLDPARILTNKSSGKMGVLLAQAANLRGARVDLIHGPMNVPTGWLEGLKTYQVKSAAELAKKLAELQPLATAIAMAAAVADFRSKASQNKEKLKKELLISYLSKNLEMVPDLLNELFIKKPKGQILLGFAALTGSDQEIQEKGIAKKISKGCDVLLANPIDRDGQGFELDSNGGCLIGPDGLMQKLPVTSKLALAHHLLDVMIQIMRQN